MDCRQVVATVPSYTVNEIFEFEEEGCSTTNRQVESLATERVLGSASVPLIGKPNEVGVFIPVSSSDISKPCDSSKDVLARDSDFSTCSSGSKESKKPSKSPAAAMFSKGALLSRSFGSLQAIPEEAVVTKDLRASSSTKIEHFIFRDSPDVCDVVGKDEVIMKIDKVAIRHLCDSALQALHDVENATCVQYCQDQANFFSEWSMELRKSFAIKDTKISSFFEKGSLTRSTAESVEKTAKEVLYKRCEDDLQVLLSQQYDKVMQVFSAKVFRSKDSSEISEDAGVEFSSTMHALFNRVRFHNYKSRLSLFVEDHSTANVADDSQDDAKKKFSVLLRIGGSDIWEERVVYVHASPSCMEGLDNSVKVSMRFCEIENVVPIWRVRDLRKLGSFGYLMPYCEKGDLFTYINLLLHEIRDGKCIDEKRVQNSLYAYHIAIALEKIHERGFVHGDIKNENILLQKYVGNDVAVISDLEFAIEVSKETIIRGTDTYVPPEAHKIILQGGDKIKMTPSWDAWSFGIVLLCLSFPEIGSVYLRDIETCLTKIRRGRGDFSDISKLITTTRSEIESKETPESTNIIKAILGLFTLDPRERMTLSKTVPLLKMQISLSFPGIKYIHVFRKTEDMRRSCIDQQSLGVSK